jgi:hypothetical protein
MLTCDQFLRRSETNNRRRLHPERLRCTSRKNENHWYLRDKIHYGAIEYTVRGLQDMRFGTF